MSTRVSACTSALSSILNKKIKKRRTQNSSLNEREQPLINFNSPIISKINKQIA